MQPSYNILYGFSENKHHGKELGKLLEQEGFLYTAHAAEADIVIAHSAGTYMLAPSSTAQIVMLVGIPMNTDKLRRTFFKSWSSDYTSHKINKKVIKKLRLLRHNTVALALHPRHQYKLVTTVDKVRHVPPNINAPQVVVVNNHNDPWPQPLFDKAYTDTYDASFVSLPGSHDHIWQAPQEYVAIINYYAARLFV
jgi:hypothetical protein